MTLRKLSLATWELRGRLADVEALIDYADAVDVVAHGRACHRLYVRLHDPREEVSTYVLFTPPCVTGPPLFVAQVHEDAGEAMTDGELWHYYDHLSEEAFIEEIRERMIA